MARVQIILATLFAVSHVAFVAPFVPIANILPAGLGMLSMSSMALALILAARWRLVDRLLGGPDKSYGAHRWLGFFALAGALGHWMLATDVGSGLLPALAPSGESMGTLAALGLMGLTVQAMVKAIPYHLWKLGHMLMGPVFLLAAYHTFFVASPLDVGAAPWSYMLLVSVIGLAAWGQTILRKRAPSQLVTVSKIRRFEGGVDLTLSSEAPLPRFKPGQFATLAHNKARAEAHPFTIAGGTEWTRRFLIRSAGDWTEDVVRSVQKGDEFRIGSGCGRFLPQISEPRREQLWVAGGVGITPFLASLERMVPDNGALITLIYCIRSRETAGALEEVEAHAARLPQLNLVIASEAGGSRLTADILTDHVQKMDERTEVFLCGPTGLKDMVESVWRLLNMRGRIHSERFDFRGALGLTDMIYIGQPLLETALNLKAEIRRNSDALARS